MIVRLLRTHHNADWLLTRSTEISIGLVFWPLLFLISSTIGFRWSSQSAWLFAVFISIFGLISIFQDARKCFFRTSLSISINNSLTVFFLLLLIITGWTRYLHAQKLVFPNWVDSIHHTMIARLLMMNGVLPSTYEPFISNSRFFYHWGYHAFLAWFGWVSGRQDPFQIAQDLLFTGQVLNTLIVFPLYSAGRTLFNSRRAGLFCAVLGSLISWFPAYYVAWGRYTQLAGVIICMTVGVELWRLHQNHNWGRFLLCVLLISGAFLVHVRLFIFGGLLVSVLSIYLLAHRQLKSISLWGIAVFCSMCLISPWLLTLSNSIQVQDALNLTSASSSIQVQNISSPISWSTIWAPMNRELFVIASGGFGWFFMPKATSYKVAFYSAIWFVFIVIAYILQARRSRYSKFLRIWKPNLLIISWSLLVILVLNYQRLPWLSNIWLPTGIIDNNSAIITLFIPFSLVGGGLLAWVSGQLVPLRYVAVITLIFLAILTCIGANSIHEIVNPATTIVSQNDLDALYWINEHTPVTAKFAINLRKWTGETYVGVDGGYWISVLTNRGSILPPAIYTMAIPYAQTIQMNQFFAEWMQSEHWDMRYLYTKLRQEGVTYLYVTSQSTSINANKLNSSTLFRQVYGNKSVTIFELR